MVKIWQQDGALDPVQRRNSSEKFSKILWHVVRGADLTLRRILLRPVLGGTCPTQRRIPLGTKSRVSATTDLKRGKKLDPSLYPQRQSRTVEYQDVQWKRSPASVDIGGRATQKWCIPIPRRVGIRLVAVGTRQTNILMVVGVQWKENRPIAACT